MSSASFNHADLTPAESGNEGGEDELNPYQMLQQQDIDQNLGLDN